MFPANRENSVVERLSVATKPLPVVLVAGINPAWAFRKLSDLFVIAGFTIFMGGGVQLLIMLRGAEGFTNLEGDTPSQMIYFSVYVFTCLFFVFSGRGLSLGIVKSFWFWLLLFWTCLSIVWSGSPWVSIRHSVALCGTTLFSVYLVNNIEMRKFVKLLAVSLLIINAASYLVIVFFPDMGIGHVVADEWKGIFTHKNHLGKAASLSVIIFLYQFLMVEKGKWIWLLGLFSSTGLLIGCQSAAAIMLSIFVAFVIGVFYLSKKMPVLLWVMFLGLIIFLIFFSIPDQNQILGYFGKDETLTGRTQLWNFCIHMALRKPLLGYGYGAFWLGANGPSAEAWAGMPMGMDITHSHNGFVEAALGVGGIGFFILLVLCLETLIKGIKLFFKEKFSFQHSLHLILLLWILPYNITEQALLDRNSIFWVLFSSVVLYLSKERFNHNETHK